MSLFLSSLSLRDILRRLAKSSDFSTCTGIFTFGMMIAGRFIFQKFGWGVAAAITPTVILVRLRLDTTSHAF